MNHIRSFTLLLIIFTAVETSLAMALPIIFTDRAAFDATVGGTSLITFDPVPTFDCMRRSDGSIITCDFFDIKVDGLLRLTGDREAFNPSGSLAGAPPGSLCSCNQTFSMGIGTIDPVLAFGFDITPVPAANIPISIAGLGFQLSQPQFLGFLFAEPTVVGISPGLYLNPNPSIGLGWSTFAIDNVAIKTVPEPSTLLFLGIGLVGLIAWEKTRRRVTTEA